MKQPNKLTSMIADGVMDMDSDVGDVIIGDVSVRYIFAIAN